VAPALREAVAEERRAAGTVTGEVVRNPKARALRREGVDYEGLPPRYAGGRVSPATVVMPWSARRTCAAGRRGWCSSRAESYPTRTSTSAPSASGSASTPSVATGTTCGRTSTASTSASRPTPDPTDSTTPSPARRSRRSAGSRPATTPRLRPRQHLQPELRDPAGTERTSAPRRGHSGPTRSVTFADQRLPSRRTREQVLAALHPDHPALPRRGPVPLARCEHAAWAAGHRGTGLDAVIRNVCNRVGGFEPEIRHRSDDGLVLAGIVASGRAVTLLPALLADSLPRVAMRPLREERVQRTIFTAARVAAGRAPAIVAVREALAATAREVARQRRDVAITEPGGRRGRLRQPRLRASNRWSAGRIPHDEHPAIGDRRQASRQLRRR